MSFGLSALVEYETSRGNKLMYDDSTLVKEDAFIHGRQCGYTGTGNLPDGQSDFLNQYS
jgi:hypothetical protein